MRPKLLEIEGLHSFKNMQKIDFETLSQTGLFGIFGPTGSGKSTILDAITFALYGKVKRAERGTQGIINISMNTARVSFTFEIQKGNSRKTYRVERVYQRKKKSDNSCEPKIARLIEITTEGEIPICDKATEVSGSIEELIGLNHDDFTRAVVLPQNSFQEFLLLDNARKRDMLERIFYLEEYGKQLINKLNKKASVLKSQMDKVGGALSMVQDATDQALEDAQKALEAAIDKKNRIEAEHKRAEAKFNEAKEVWELEQELDHINNMEKQHIALKEEMEKNKIKLDKAIKADGLLEMVNKTAELSQKLADTETKMDGVQKRLLGVIQELNNVRLKYDNLKKESETEMPRLVALKARLSDALKIREEVGRLESRLKEFIALEAGLKKDISSKSEAISRESAVLAKMQQEMEGLLSEVESLRISPEYRQDIQEAVKLETEVESLNKSLEDFKSRLESINKVILARENELKRAQDDIKKFQNLMEALNSEIEKHEALKPEGRDRIQKVQEEYHRLLNLCSVLKLKKKEVEGLGAKVEKLNQTASECARTIEAAEAERKKAELYYEKCHSEMERALKARDQDIAYILSKSLKEGEPCPVCGSLQHPCPAVAQRDEVGTAKPEEGVEKAESQLKLAEKLLRDAENTLIVARERMKAVNAQIAQAAEELKIKTDEYGRLKEDLPERLRGLSLVQLDDELKRMKQSGEEKLKAIEEWERKQDELRQEALMLNEKLSRQLAEEKGISAALKVNQENKEQLEHFVKQAGSKRENKLREYRQFLEYYKIASASSELERLSENDRKTGLLEKKIEQAKRLIEQKKSLLEQMKEEHQSLINKSIKVEADRNSYQREKNEKETNLRKLAGNMDIEAEINKIDEKLAEYSTLEKQYRDRQKDLETLYNDLVSQKTVLKNQGNIYAKSLEDESRRLDAAIRDMGFVDIDDVRSSILPKESQRALKLQLDEYEQNGRNIGAQKHMVLKKMGSRSIKEEEWNRIDSAYRELSALREESVSRCEAARSNYGMIKDKHERWAELSKSYSELAHKYGLFEQIYKLLKAEKGKENSFIDFIAEERLRYVAYKASETLGLMTKYKYALELDTNSGFIIRDNANGGMHRMVTTLSGGEIFLTSLSLALALSEHIQLKGQSPLEFFFLDEGFGTLDDNLLNVVIDSLERLSCKERVIGLISHVPELRRRINRRLIVEPPSSMGDGSRVRVEVG